MIATKIEAVYEVLLPADVSTLLCPFNGARG